MAKKKPDTETGYEVVPTRFWWPAEGQYVSGGAFNKLKMTKPGVALFVPDNDPLRFYRSFAGHAPFLLKPGGWFVVETHEDHGEDVRHLFDVSDLHEVELRNDLAGKPRIVSARFATVV